jgi:hypothetical protein
MVSNGSVPWCVKNALTKLIVPLAGSDIRGHSFGTKAFIRSPSMMTTTPSLRQAVYWSGLRQEIYNALSLHQAPDIELRSLDLDSHLNSLGPDAGDCAWANQAITHCAHVLVFCFGEGPRSAAVYADLKAHNQQWSETRPDSFDPYFVGEDVAVGTQFPDIRYGCPWHGTYRATFQEVVFPGSYLGYELRLIAWGYSNWQPIYRSCPDLAFCARSDSAYGWTSAHASDPRGRCTCLIPIYITYSSRD